LGVSLDLMKVKLSNEMPSSIRRSDWGWWFLS
jgi:hypothetical protein